MYNNDKVVVVQKTIGVLAFGSCYLDVNVAEYPFSDDGILPDTELIGGQYELAAGGSAVNFCRTVQGLGVQTMFVGMRGDDIIGRAVEDLIVQSEVAVHFGFAPNIMTNISYDMTNISGKHIMLIAGTANQHFSAATLLPILKEKLKSTQMLYVGGAYKLLALRSTFDEIIAIARAAGTKIIVDHGRVPVAAPESMVESVKKLVESADYYFPSRDEFLKTWHFCDVAEGLRHLKLRTPQLEVIVKNGDDGAYYIEDDQMVHIDAVKVEVLGDVTGAGDAFNAGVIASLLNGEPMRTAVQNGCTLAAKKISREGAL